MHVCDAGVEKTALAVYWVMDGVDRCQVGFTPWHFVKDGIKFDGELAQVMEVYSVNDTNNHKRQKVYKNFGFAKAVLILEVDNTTKESELELNTSGTLKKTICNNGGDKIKEVVCVTCVFQCSIEKYIL